MINQLLFWPRPYSAVSRFHSTRQGDKAMVSDIALNVTVVMILPTKRRVISGYTTDGMSALSVDAVRRAPKLNGSNPRKSHPDAWTVIFDTTPTRIRIYVFVKHLGQDKLEYTEACHVRDGDVLWGTFIHTPWPSLTTQCKSCDPSTTTRTFR